MSIPGIINKDPYLTPHKEVIEGRMQRVSDLKSKFMAQSGSLSGFALGHLYFGQHSDESGWVFREWAPNATKIFLIGSFNDWKEQEDYRFKKLSLGIWELKVTLSKITHLDLYKLSIHWEQGHGERIPAWAVRVVQDPDTLIFNAQIWEPENRYNWKFDHPGNTGEAPLIYEAHVGMATEEYGIGTYDEFREKVLPRIIKAGYNTIQLMAIQEHPYYGSFGYHVSSFFAPSSRFGDPETLKRLIDEAHGAGIKVIMDLVHSHAVKNEVEGPGRYDGSPYQFFHDGPRREHIAWDSLCFNYGKNEVIHFLLSNIQYWLKVFKFDGFRFDGVTSMLYYDHGLGRNFVNYDMYFDGHQDEDAIAYLALANELIQEINPYAISLAEEMSGYPGLAAPVKDGGLGFNYRMAMGTPDYWIKIIKEVSDENWNVEEMFYELTNKRAEEKTVGYAESHDQALVGDKTIIFRLVDKEMYFDMNKDAENLIVERGVALHKMIRLITIATSGNGYLNFMGNEFGHPEWIDFPREGNNWSYQYARRQWSLVDHPDLRFHYLSDFDREMIRTIKKYNVLENCYPVKKHCNTNDQVLAFERGELLFIFNFNPVKSFPDYGVRCSAGIYKVILDTDLSKFGGQERVNNKITYRAIPEKNYSPDYMLRIYIPSRIALVLKRNKTKNIYDLQ
jgi:1,4-alpha-glucan branching enzyme